MPWLSGLQGQCLCAEKQRCPSQLEHVLSVREQAHGTPWRGFLALHCTSLVMLVPGSPRDTQPAYGQPGGWRVIAPKWGSTCGPGVDRPMSSLLSPGGTSEVAQLLSYNL